VEAVIEVLQARETGDTQGESCWNVCCGRGGGGVMRDQTIDARLLDREASPLISAAPEPNVSMIIVVSTNGRTDSLSPSQRACPLKD
jgi:hypothetical protein